MELTGNQECPANEATSGVSSGSGQAEQRPGEPEKFTNPRSEFLEEE